MIDAAMVELINKEIDGATTPEESALVRAFCASHAEGRQLYEDLKALSDGLRNHASVSPPATLRPAVMRTIQARAHVPAGMNLRSDLFRLFRPRGGWRPAVVFSGGLVAGILLFAVVTALVGPGKTDERDYSGSIVVPDTPAGVGVSFRGQVVQGSVATELGSGHLVVVIRMTGSGEGTASLEYDKSVYAIKALDLSRARGRIVTDQSGKTEYRGPLASQINLLFTVPEGPLPPMRFIVSQHETPDVDLTVIPGTAK